MQGKLIVFEGTDGSGKATQSELLCQELTRRGVPYRKLTFPRYQEESSALVRLYLGGAFGQKPGDVNAYAAAAFYSVDRYASYKQDWGSYYEQGGLLIADRYTTSNAVHQTSKLPPEQQRPFVDWLFDFEYQKLGLPAPDRVLYLDLPTELSEQMMRRREEATHTHADIHEQDEAYLRSCRESAARVVDWCGWQGRPDPQYSGHPSGGSGACGGSAAVKKDGTPQRPVPVRPNPMVCVCPYVPQQEQRESPPQQRSFCPPPQQQSTSKTMTISQMQEQLLLSKHT